MRASGPNFVENTGNLTRRRLGKHGSLVGTKAWGRDLLVNMIGRIKGIPGKPVYINQWNQASLMWDMNMDLGCLYWNFSTTHDDNKIRCWHHFGHKSFWSYTGWSYTSGWLIAASSKRPPKKRLCVSKGQASMTVFMRKYYCPGAHLTNYISIGFKIRPIFAVLWFKMFSTDHNKILHISRPLHRRDVCKIPLRSVEHISN